MIKKPVMVLALLLLVGSLFVLGQDVDGGSVNCSFLCKVKQVLSGREEAGE